MLKRSIIYLALFVVFFALGFFGTIYFLPYAIMRGMQSSRALSIHQFVHTDLPTDKSRLVVAPNPDFLYSLAIYSIKNGSVCIEGQLPDSTYASISLFDQNSSCYYVRNDQQFNNKNIKICLALDGQSNPDENTIIAPSPYGVVLLRFLATHPEKASSLKKIQNSFKIK